jgi:hypothetical protein
MPKVLTQTKLLASITKGMAHCHAASNSTIPFTCTEFASILTEEITWKIFKDFVTIEPCII